MQLSVHNIAAEDTWKDIVRIKKKFRVDSRGKPIPRGKVCRISVGDKSKWVIVHGRIPDNKFIEMDLNVRIALGVDVNETHEFILHRFSWIRSLWFPWKASDPIYRLPAQLSLVSFFLGVILGVFGIVVGLIPLHRDRHSPAPSHQSSCTQ